jgi:hypothetical protein
MVGIGWMFSIMFEETSRAKLGNVYVLQEAAID